MNWRLSFLFWALPTLLIAQKWHALPTKIKDNDSSIDFKPTRYQVAQVDDAEIKKILWSTQVESDYKAKATLLKIMMPDQTIKTFAIQQYSMMEPALAARFPEIRTYSGQQVDDPHTRIHLSYTVHGLRASISGHGEKTYIDYYQRGDKNTKIIYRKADYPNKEDFSCSVENMKIDKTALPEHSHRSAVGNCTLHTLRLAISVTGEYSTYHGASSDGTPADHQLVHSAVVTSVDRMNQVFQQDLGIRMILVANNDDLYYFDASNDPFTNQSSSATLNTNQTTTNNIIGSANYDIGHNYNTGANSGLAQLFAACNNNGKARGASGRIDPIGDPFSVDYVAHEIGHQLGAKHTQNNDCNRNNNTAVEPGSASTIMGYAGICSPNVQGNSDDHYHAISINEIRTGNGASTLGCAQQIQNFGNSDPTVTVATTSYTIPHSTPFILTAMGGDADGDPLTYCWEQIDNEIATMPPQPTNTSGPAFRSVSPSPSPSRYFPSFANLKSGVTTWEVLPSVARTMDFRVTVRDWHDGPGDSDAGCTSEVDVSVTTSGSIGSFDVTSHSADEVWTAGTTKTVTWDVAGTTSSPISCANVDIVISTDGSTFDNAIVLAANVPNNGSASITVPNIDVALTRYMVRCSDNIFFDINDGHITIGDYVSKCNTYSPSDLPITISASGTPTITSNLTVAESGQLSNLKITSLQGTHTYMSDLNFTLISPDGSSLQFWSEPCSNTNNFDIKFDDAAANNSWPCPPVDGLWYQPDNALRFLDGKEVNGQWSLQVYDDTNQDGGSLNAWSIEICSVKPANACDLVVSNTNTSGPGSFQAAYDCAEAGDVILLSSDIANSDIPLSGGYAIDKDITIRGNQDGVNFDLGIGTLYILGGRTVTLEGFSVTHNGPLTTLNNSGSLTLKNMKVYNNNKLQVYNSSGSMINVDGNVELKK